MKIVHVIIAAFYKEGFGYQENILPAKHKELGFETRIITYNNDVPDGKTYVNNDDVEVVMLPFNKPSVTHPYLRMFMTKTRGLYEQLNQFKPDIIFVHGLQSIDSLDVVRWCKENPSCKLYVDQHADYYNTPIVRFTYRMYAKYVYGYIAKRLAKYTSKFWGVTPWRVDYLNRVYGLDSRQIDLLVMGGDDKYIDWENRMKVKENIRKKYNVPSDAFLVVTGGKIDKAKNIHLLIDAIRNIKNENVYLLFFGNFTPDMEQYCMPKVGKQIKYAGWMDSNSVYPLFLASDLAVFPGTHSVLWEQAMACGIPGIFKDWNGGFSHIDCGGNAVLLKDITEDSLSNAILDLINDNAKYLQMKDVAEDKGRKTFSYLEIAKRAIELC